MASLDWGWLACRKEQLRAACSAARCLHPGGVGTIICIISQNKATSLRRRRCAVLRSRTQALSSAISCQLSGEGLSALLGSGALAVAISGA